MGNAKFVGRIGALAVALGVGVAMAITPPVASAEEANCGKSSTPDRTALIMGGGTVPKPDQYLVDVIKNQYIEPTHSGEDIECVAVAVRMEAWPITGLVRLIGVVFGPQEVWGPGGAGWWPDEPWWKLTGLFDLTADQAVQAGLGNLETAMAEHGNDHLVIYGASEGSWIATEEKRKLAEQYPMGSEAPDIDFVLQATMNLPNGGIHARFPGLPLPIGWTLNGHTPTDTQFDTVMINRQYDGIADFPLYPINLIATLNALLGTVYVHPYAWDVSLAAPDPTKLPSYQGKHGDTDYYFFENPDLPLFGPLRTLGVPESLIDVVEPFFRVIVELGYDRSIKPWEPTPARLIPVFNPVTVAADLVGAIGEGTDNALAIVAPPPSASAPPPIVPTPRPGAPAVPATKQAVDPEETIDAQQRTDGERKSSQTDGGRTLQAMDGEQISGDVTDGEKKTGQANGADRAAPAIEPAKQADPPATRRPVEPGPLGTFRQRMRDLFHRGNGDQTSTFSVRVGDPSTTAEGSQESPPAGSPTTGDSPGGDGLSGADGDAA